LLRDHPAATVRVLDDFSSGAMTNLPFAAAAGARLEVVRGDVRELAAVERVARGASVIFHQAAMRSVPRSVNDPLGANDHNVNGDGKQSRDFTYIDNVVEANVLAARAPAASGEAFNVGCGERVSLLDIIDRLEKLLGKPLKRRHTPTRAGDVPHTLADIGKARRLMDYTPLVDFDEGLRRTVDFFKH